MNLDFFLEQLHYYVLKTVYFHPHKYAKVPHTTIPP